MELHPPAEVTVDEAPADDCDVGWRVRLRDYLRRLPLDAAARAALQATAERQPDAVAGFTALHHALAGDEAGHFADPATASLGKRFELACGNPHDRHGRPLLSRDAHDRPRLATMPTFRRASMVPRPWSANPLTRAWRWITGGRFGRRGRLVGSGPESQSPDPHGRWRWSGLARRLVLLTLMLGQTAVATYYMTAVLPYHGAYWLEQIILALYAILFAWVSAGFWTAMMGFLTLMMRGDRHAISLTASAADPMPGDGRTALLMPICNEDVPRVFAGLRATYESVRAGDALEHFDFFVLSDSDDPDTRIAELDAWQRLCAAVDGFGRVFYRRRTHRIKRKSGNVADWCRRWGSQYRYMVILDADSVMSGDCLTRLVKLMEANPNAGIIQTAPRAAGRETLYARMQQFATRVYGPLFTAGLHFWQLGESHYWGHNAIIRVAPFIRHCALPRLPGRGALSGEILSHDFVEAALMRRAGWAVWIAYDLPGSYEEMPPNLLDELKRDRRWCQGNLQNFRLFLAQGLHPAHRAVFMTGVMAYLSAPLWFLFLVASTALLVVQTYVPPDYFSHPYQLFPNWPEWHPGWAVGLFSATATLLLLPKLLATVIAAVRDRRGHGGALRLFVSMVVETVFSALLAPIRMLFHTQFVTGALSGMAVSWKSPPREDSRTSWGEAIVRHGPGSLLGSLWAGGVYYVNPQFLWWLAPVVGALILAVPLSVWSSLTGPGRLMRRMGLFLIPEEGQPPAELRCLRSVLAATPKPPGFVEGILDPGLCALLGVVHTPRPKLPAADVEERCRRVRLTLHEGPAAPTERVRNALTADPDALARLHFGVWTTPAPRNGWGDHLSQ